MLPDQTYLKELLVVALHETRLKQYKEIYKNRNGQEPGKEDINHFIALLIASGGIDKEAEEIIQKVTQSVRNKNILINTSYSVPTIILISTFMCVLYQGEVPDFMKSGTYYWGTMLTAGIIVAFIIISTITSFFEDKRK